jgi:glycogen synthase
MTAAVPRVPKYPSDGGVPENGRPSHGLDGIRILHVTHEYAPQIGGTQRLVQGLSEYLRNEAGLDVTVLTAAVGGKGARRRETVNGVPVVRVRAYPRVERFLSQLYRLPGGWRLLTRHLPAIHAHLSRDPLAPGVTRAIMAFSPDLVLTTAVPSSACAHTYWARLRKPFKVAVLPACPTEWWDRDYRGISSGVEWALVRDAEMVFAHTAGEAAYFERRGIPGERIALMGAGTDEMHVAAALPGSGNPLRSRENPTIAFVGRLVPGKGLDVLLKAMPAIWGRLPKMRLLVAGPDGAGTARILAEHRHVLQEAGTRVQLLGACDDRTKSQLLDACDVLALPSSIESFGIVFIEAWAHRKPVIGCRTTAMSTLIGDGVDGLLVPYGDSGALAEAIVQTLTDTERAAAMGRAGYAKVTREYTWAAVGRRVAAAYVRMVGRAPVRARAVVARAASRCGDLPWT